MVSSEAGHCGRRSRRASQKSRERKQGHIHAGNHQKVIDAGLLEFFTDIAQEQRIIAHDHGGKNSSVFAAPEAALVNMLQDAVADAAAPEAKTAARCPR